MLVVKESGLPLCILVKYRQTPVYTHNRTTHKILAVLCASDIPLDNWAISTSIRHFPYYISKLCPERRCKDRENSITFVPNYKISY